ATTLGDLRSVVRHADFVVKQLAPYVPDELRQLTGVLEQRAAGFQLLNSSGQGDEERLEVTRPPVVVSLLGHPASGSLYQDDPPEAGFRPVPRAPARGPGAGARNAAPAGPARGSQIISVRASGTANASER